jgi:hypothetical protein
LNLGFQSDSVRAIGCTLESFPDGRLGGLDVVPECGSGGGIQLGFGLRISSILPLARLSYRINEYQASALSTRSPSKTHFHESSKILDEVIPAQHFVSQVG